MSTTTDAISEMKAKEEPFDIDEAFRTHYGRVARVIARVVHDFARAEELAVEVFLKLWRTEKPQTDKVEAWLYRVAVRTALNELRGRLRRTRYERLFGLMHSNPVPATPEQIRRATEEQERVYFVLGRLENRQAEFLILRSHGFSYEEVATILNISPTSIGTLLSRAQEAFRKEYTKKYGSE